MESNYKNLVVWQKPMVLTLNIYKIVKKLPKEEMFALSDQMRRVAVSFPSNIAEGCGKRLQGELKYFLRIASGSAAELETQMQICLNLGYLQSEDIEESLSLLHEVEKMLNSFMNSKKLSSAN
ncbi:MAG: four helix bundle protein [Fibrobacter sp.]|uniref:four helix bundle protein n=1 Tax=Fibrobacter sp. TaxID=35828 RepID=UPI0025C681FE|nr:four helix bundle protein [Fibrobacter sp.]MBQ7080414.1 four helix bundle protein [Fibrobacter sp.]